MRLKEDSSSYKSSNVKRKMFRQSPLEFRGKHRSRKDTKRWCKGKVGVEHDYQLIKESRFSIFTWNTYICAVCSKKEIHTIR